MLIPPPLLFAAAFGIGTLLDRGIRLPATLAALAPPAFVGVAILAVGLILVAPGPILFMRHWTTIVPHRTARSLVTSGPFRVTRNPMYLGLTLVYVGTAVIVHAPGPIVLLTVPLWVLDTKTIPYEERSLLDAFRDDYRRYANRTRRWI